MIEEANGLVVAAGQAGCVGRFQLEAAIQAVDARRRDRRNGLGIDRAPL